MKHVRTLRHFLVVLVALAATTALAQTTETEATSDVGANVEAVNQLSIDADTVQLDLAPTEGEEDDSIDTSVTFETNDGLTYRIEVAPDIDGWVLTNAADNAADGNVPELTMNVTNVDAEAGTVSEPSTGEQTLIDSDNNATPKDALGDLINVKGSATVAIGASITQSVIAGDYDVVLTYTLTAE